MAARVPYRAQLEQRAQSSSLVATTLAGSMDFTSFASGFRDGDGDMAKFDRYVVSAHLHARCAVLTVAGATCVQRPSPRCI